MINFLASPEASDSIGLSDEKATPKVFHTKLISTLSTTDLVAEIESILNKNAITFAKKGFVFKCKSTVCFA